MARLFREEDEPGEEEIMIVPLIDIVFLLLIFFLVTASMKKPIREWDIRMPTASYATKGRFHGDELVITFTGKEIHLASTLGGAKEKVSQTEMRTAFKAAGERTPRPHVRIEADGSVPMREVAKVIDTLAAYDLREISFRANDR